MQKRMKGSRPRTPGGRYADGSSNNPSIPGGGPQFTPARVVKPAVKKTAPGAEGGSAP